MSLPHTVGLDVGDRMSRLAMVDGSGEVVEESRIRTTPAGLHRRFAAMPSARVVLEVGTHSAWISRLLSELGHEVIVANSRKLRFIYASNDKSDPVDAEALARVGRLDPTLLAPIQHRSARAQADLALVRSRDLLVRCRSQLICHARGSAKAVGTRLPRCSAPAFVAKTLVHVPEELQPDTSRRTASTPPAPRRRVRPRPSRCDLIEKGRTVIGSFRGEPRYAAAA